MESSYMNEDEAYLDVAKRFVESCEKHIDQGINIQEVIGFKSYHAFESIGGAYNAHYGNIVPMGHARKINAFVANSNHNHPVNYRAIATLAILLASMRNKYLYPEETVGNYINPKDQISMTSAKEITRRVRGIIKEVARIIE